MKTTDLVKNKAIGTQQGFADTFNWLVRSMKNLQGGQGCDVNWADDYTPVVNVNMYECGNEYLRENLAGAFEPMYKSDSTDPDAPEILSGCSNCVFCAGRTYVDAGTLTISATSSSTGYVVLTLTHPSPYATWQASNASLGIESDIPTNNSDSLTKIPLYHITDGVVDIDLRNIPTAVLAR